MTHAYDPIIRQTLALGALVALAAGSLMGCDPEDHDAPLATTDPPDAGTPDATTPDPQDMGDDADAPEDPGPDDAGIDPDASTGDVGPPPPNYALVALDQEVEEARADTIVIESVTSSTPTWLIIDGSDGSTGRERLAVVPVTSGAQEESIEVTLSRPVAYNERLFAALHADNGTPGTFEPEVDTPVTGAAGDAQGNDFRVTVVYEPVIEVSDQIASVTRTAPFAPTVLIPRVVSPRGGYVVVSTGVYDALGHAVVPPGERLFVEVPLSRPPNRLEELVVTLGYEEPDNDNGMFDGIFEDGVVRTGSPARVFQKRFVADVPAVEFNSITDIETLDAMPVERVVAPPGCLLVLHEELDDGSAGPALGALTVPEGESLDLSIPISAPRPLISRERVLARLYFDDPVNVGTFEGTEVALEDLSGAYFEDSTRIRVGLDPGIVTSFYVEDQQLKAPDEVELRQIVWRGTENTVLYLFEFDPVANPSLRDDPGPLNFPVGGQPNFIVANRPVTVYRPIAPGTRIWVAAFADIYHPPGSWSLEGLLRFQPDGVTPWMTSFEILP